MRIAVFGTYDADAHPRVRVVAEGLAALGDDVVEVNAPIGLDTGWRVRALRRPWLVPVWLARMLVSWLRLIRRARRVGTVDAVVVGYLGHLDVHLAGWLWRRRPVALDHLVSLADTAVDRRSTNRVLVSVLDRVDRAALRAADAVFVDTDEHRRLLPPPVRRDAVVVPVGAPERWFRSPSPPPDDTVQVVFFGLYTPLQGAVTIGEAIALLADEPRLSFTMIGTGQDLDAARSAAAANPRVTWIDWVEAAELPDAVAAHHVCLGIFGDTSKAHRVVPNKVFQGAAAGCAVVTADTGAQREALGAGATLVPPADPGALAAALRRLADDPDELQRRRLASFEHADEEFRPARVAAPLRARLADLVGPYGSPAR